MGRHGGAGMSRDERCAATGYWRRIRFPSRVMRSSSTCAAFISKAFAMNCSSAMVLGFNLLA